MMFAAKFLLFIPLLFYFINSSAQAEDWPKMFDDKPSGQTGWVDDIFTDKSSKPAKSVDGIFRDKATSPQAGNPLNDVIKTWLKEDKAKLQKEHSETEQRLSAKCSSKPSRRSNFRLTLSSGCNKKQARRGYSCSQQKAAKKRQRERARAARRKESNIRYRQALREWHAACEDYNRREGKPDPEYTAKMRELNNAIAEDTKTSNRFATLEAQLKAEREAAFAQRESELLEKKRLRERQQERRKQARLDKIRKIKKAEADRIKKCQALYYKQNKEPPCWCPPPPGWKGKTCSR